MLKRMRKHARSNFIKVVLGMIILAFVFWGISAVVRGTRVDVVATIDGDPITVSSYEKQVEELRRLYRNLYRDNYSTDLEKAMNLQGQALEKLVENHLLLREAQRLGLAVSDEEVAASVMATFQVEGRFDPQYYRNALRSQNMTPSQFEGDERERLLIAKMENLLTDGITVGEEEIRDAFLAENEKLTLAYVKVPFARFASQVKVDDEAIEAYYNANKEEFRQPAKVSIEFAAYPPERFEEAVQISEEEVRRAYERRTEEFTLPEDFHLRHLLVAVPPGADEKAKEKLLEKAQQLRERLAQGEDFATLAREASDDEASAAAGGDLGFVPVTELEDALAQAVKNLEVGKISTVVEGKKGFEIVKVEEHRTQRVKPLEEVREEIVATLRKQGGDEAALEARLQDLTRVRGGEDFAAVVKRRGLVARRATAVARGERIPDTEGAQELIDRAFKLKEGEADQVRSLTPPYYLLRVLEKIPSAIPPLEKVRESVKERLARQRAREAALEFGRQALREIASGKTTLAELAKNEGLKVEETSPFSIQDPTAGGLGGRPDLAKEFFKLSPQSPLAQDPVALPDGVALVRLKERTTPEPGELDDEAKRELRKRIRQQKQQEAIASFRNFLKSRSDIRVNPERLAGVVGST